jgi:hypothetical protein
MTHLFGGRLTKAGGLSPPDLTMALQPYGVVHAAEPKLPRNAVGSFLEPTNSCGDSSSPSAGIGRPLESPANMASICWPELY